MTIITLMKINCLNVKPMACSFLYFLRLYSIMYFRITSIGFVKNYVIYLRRLRHINVDNNEQDFDNVSNINNFRKSEKKKK